MTPAPFEAARLGGREGLRSWLICVASGMLVPRAVVSIGFVVAPWLTAVFHVTAATRVAAAAVLFAQVASTVVLLRLPGRRSTNLFMALLAVDFLLCGVVLGAEHQLWGVGVPMAILALAMSFEVAGWVTVGTAAVLIAVGYAAAAWLGIRTPLLWPDTLMFGTALSVETSFAGTPVVDAAVWSFSTALHVETSFGGVSGLGWTTALFLPVPAIALAALATGALVNIRRVRRARSASAARAPLVYRGLVGVALILLLGPVSAASAQCDPAGRAAFIAGLDALGHGDLHGASRIFFELVQKQPACPEARNNLAVLFVEQDRLEDAAAQLQAALQLNPDYVRARVNRARVEALLKERQARRSLVATPSPPAPSPTPIDAEPEAAAMVDAEATAAEAEHPDETPTATPSAEATANATAPDDGHGAATPSPSATPADRRVAACVIEPRHNRVCVYQLGNARMVAEACYPVAATEVRAWPRSLVASEVTAQRIRLLDESGQTRLEIVADDAQVSGDALRLRKADWLALAARVVPWRTAWLVVE